MQGGSIYPKPGGSITRNRAFILVFYTAMVTSIIAIRLPAALEKFIASQVREGRYRSREAAIVAAVLHQKQRSEQLAWLRTKIQKGLDSGPAGELNIEGIIRRG